MINLHERMLLIVKPAIFWSQLHVHPTEPPRPVEKGVLHGCAFPGYLNIYFLHTHKKKPNKKKKKQKKTDYIQMSVYHFHLFEIVYNV